MIDNTLLQNKNDILNIYVKGQSVWNTKFVIKEIDKKKAKEFLEQNPEVLAEVESLVRAKLAEG